MATRRDHIYSFSIQKFLVIGRIGILLVVLNSKCHPLDPEKGGLTGYSDNLDDPTVASCGSL